MRYLIFLVLLSCTNKEVTQPTKEVGQPTSSTSTPIDVTSTNADCKWVEKSKGVLKYSKITETSGMCFNGESLFLHDDSGNRSRVHTTKDFVSFKSIDIPFKNNDWEAIDCNKNTFTIFDIGKSGWNKDPATLITCKYDGTNCVSNNFYWPSIGKDAESALMYEDGTFFIMEKLYDQKNPDIYKGKIGNSKLEKAYTLDWKIIKGDMKIISDMSLSPSEKKFMFVEIDNNDKNKVTWFVCDEDLRIGFNHKCTKHESRNLGQIESSVWLGENEIMFTTEGSNPEYYIMACK